VSPARLIIDPWDPSYGTAVESDELEPSDAEVNLEIEFPAVDWRPLRPDVLPARRVLFVDGVRRIEAYVWIEAEAAHDSIEGPPLQNGICASVAAGAVLCNGKAEISTTLVGRGLYSAAPEATDLVTKAGLFAATVASGGQLPQLSLAVQHAMGELERAAAEGACATETVELVVVDGPLRGRAHLEGAIGYVKTHHVAYLPPAQHRLVAGLQPGERTPLFTLGTGWTRYSWYMRLGGGVTHAWSGIVRCECSPNLAPQVARELADRATATLPRYASEAHKEARAPQNLYPIGGLERELRRRLGDPMLVYRALRAAVASGSDDSDRA
jgi:hypothetical protein